MTQTSNKCMFSTVIIEGELITSRLFLTNLVYIDYND